MKKIHELTVAHTGYQIQIREKNKSTCYLFFKQMNNYKDHSWLQQGGGWQTHISKSLQTVVNELINKKVLEVGTEALQRRSDVAGFVSSSFAFFSRKKRQRKEKKNKTRDNKKMLTTSPNRTYKCKEVTCPVQGIAVKVDRHKHWKESPFLLQERWVERRR